MVRLANLWLTFLTKKDKKDIQFAKKIGCNWIALSYLQNSKIIKSTRKIINSDMGIIAKIENSMAVKNIDDIIGFVHAFEMLKKPNSISEILLPIEYVHEPNLITEVLKKLTRKRKTIAVVLAVKKIDSFNVFQLSAL